MGLRSLGDDAAEPALSRSTNHTFVVVSGLPASGKSLLARRLSPLLNLPCLDKDDFLDHFLRRQPDVDAPARRFLSRESDKQFQEEAMRVHAAVLVSFWHVPGMPSDSGTPTEWLTASTNSVVHLHCVCPPLVAAKRFVERTRHPGHGDRHRRLEDLVADFQSLADLGMPPIPDVLKVDTSGPVDVEALAGAIQARLPAA